MAKTELTTTISPLEFGTGQQVTFENTLALSKLINQIGCNYPVVHLSMMTAPDGWDGSSAKGYQDIFFTGTNTERYRFYIKIDADTEDITVGAQCWFNTTPAAGNVSFTISATTTTIGFTDADNGNEKKATVGSVATIGGAGWHPVSVKIERTGGSDADNALRFFRVQDERVLTPPDPVLE
jgi:hypothetical protein